MFRKHTTGIFSLAPVLQNAAPINELPFKKITQHGLEDEAIAPRKWLDDAIFDTSSSLPVFASAKKGRCHRFFIYDTILGKLLCFVKP